MQLSNMQYTAVGKQAWRFRAGFSADTGGEFLAMFKRAAFWMWCFTAWGQPLVQLVDWNGAGWTVDLKTRSVTPYNTGLGFLEGVAASPDGKRVYWASLGGVEAVEAGGKTTIPVGLTGNVFLD